MWVIEHLHLCCDSAGRQVFSGQFLSVHVKYLLCIAAHHRSLIRLGTVYDQLHGGFARMTQVFGKPFAEDERQISLSACKHIIYFVRRSQFFRKDKTLACLKMAFDLLCHLVVRRIEYGKTRVFYFRCNGKAE